MRKCTNCGTEVGEEAVSCPSCGLKRPTDGWMPLSVSVPFFSKLFKAARLDSELYEIIEHDPTAIRDALLAIIFVNVLSGLGNWLLLPPSFELLALVTLVLHVGSAILKWFVLTFATYFAGVTLLRGTANLWEVGRTIAFAYAPVGLQILLPAAAFSPTLVFLTLVGTNIWMIVALIVALRQSLDTTTIKAFAVALIGGVFYIIASYMLTLFMLFAFPVVAIIIWIGVVVGFISFFVAPPPP